jgi:hypothetical protein
MRPSESNLVQVSIVDDVKIHIDRVQQRKPVGGFPYFLWLSFARWSSSAGCVLLCQRIYVRGHWTPFVTVRRRYPWRSFWFGVWPEPLKPVTFESWVKQLEVEHGNEEESNEADAEVTIERYPGSK